MATYGQTVTLDELSNVMKRIADNLPATVRVAAQAHAMAVLREVVVNQMTGQRLGVVTGTARRSMVGMAGPGRSFPAAQFRVAVEEQTLASDNRVLVNVGSPLSYVKAHEMGFTGRVSVRPHMANRMVKKLVGVLEDYKTVKVKGHQRHSDGFAEWIDGYSYQRKIKHAVYAKQIESVQVRGHSMMINIRARHFLRLGIYKLRAELPLRVKKALTYAASKGAVPKFSDVAAAGGSGA